jgi:hypothetical protein
VFLTLGFIAYVIGLVQLLAIRIHSMPLFILSVISTVVVSYIIYIAMIRAATEPARMTAGEVLTRVEHFIIPSALISLIVILSTMGGVMLIVLPGIIVAFLSMFSVFALIVDHYQQTDAIVYSWYLVKKKWLQIIVRMLVANIVFSVIAFGVLALFWSFGIGESPMQTVLRAREGSLSISMTQSILEQAVTNFFTLPITIAFMAVLYASLKKVVHDVPSDAFSNRVKKYIKILTGLGIAFVIIGVIVSSIHLASILAELIQLTHAPAAVFTAF